VLTEIAIMAENLCLRSLQQEDAYEIHATCGYGRGVGISKIMFCAYLIHSQATAYFSQMVDDEMVLNDVEKGKRFYRTTSKGGEHLPSRACAGNRIWERKHEECDIRRMDFGRHPA